MCQSPHQAEIQAIKPILKPFYPTNLQLLALSVNHGKITAKKINLSLLSHKQIDKFPPPCE